MEKRKSEDSTEINKKRKTSDSKDEFESTVGYIFPSDTEISLRDMRKKFPKEKFCNKIPPLIFVHQLFKKHNANTAQIYEEIVSNLVLSFLKRYVRSLMIFYL